jgi:amidophosphoribosyltransferase
MSELDYLDCEKFRDQCGLFGVYGTEEASKLLYLGLFALQHRGQESCGIFVADGYDIIGHKNMGLVTSVFDTEKIDELKGRLGIGHVRYSTAGVSELINAQPLLVKYSKGKIAIAHNGNLINAIELRTALEEEGSIFQTTSDSEVIVHLLARSKKEDLVEGLCEILPKVKGAYSLLFLDPKRIIAIRDPLGIRPLCLGKKDDAYVVASETCAFDLIGADYIRDIEPGEILIIEEDGIRSKNLLKTDRVAHCIFECIYFARPDSFVFERSVHQARKEMGKALAQQYPTDADIIIPIPDSGNSAALGYAEASGIPFEFGLVRNHYIGRTFIAPVQMSRSMGVQLKLNPVLNVLKDKRVIVIDDSIVRGTTCRRIIKILRSFGARQIHLRISSPPVKFPCFYGIDTPTRSELIASTHTIEEIERFLGVDSLGYLSIEAMLKSVKGTKDEFCISCFDGSYPIMWEGEKCLEGLRL